MVGAERLDLLGLPRGKLLGMDPAEVEGIVEDSTTAALSNQVIVSPNPYPLIPVIVYPPPSQRRLGKKVGQVAPERLLRSEDTGGIPGGMHGAFSVTW
jgi:hypothetical protein